MRIFRKLRAALTERQVKNMSELTAILKYQETDKKLFALERELASCDERKEFVKVKKFLEGAAEKLDSLESKARGLKEKAAAVEEGCTAAEKDLADFAGIDELIKSGGDVSYYKKAAQKQLDALRKTKSELAALVKSVKETDQEYKELKKQVIAMQKKYAEANEKYKAVKASRDDERKALEKELACIAKDIPEEAMNKYLAKRKEKVFPVVFPLTDGRCPCCGMEVPLAARSKLKEGVIECESCRRILYQPQ